MREAPSMPSDNLMSNQPPKPGDTIRVLSVNPDGTLEVEVIEKRVATVRLGPKWASRPDKGKP